MGSVPTHLPQEGVIWGKKWGVRQSVLANIAGALGNTD